jgi:PHD/YefM family antitoxin component YafN of YafNO toxin-antitoxin module
MIAINVTEFRGNMKKYLEAAENEKLIIHGAKGKAYAIVPVEEVKENPFSLSPEQKTAIDEALDDVANGRVHSHHSVMEETKKRFPRLFKR